MRRGFIYNHNLCVGCKACIAGCILENGWDISVRNVFTYNSEAEEMLPVINLTLACNHCEKAVCMTGCPASAISRDKFSGAVVVDESKCLGCRYCQWNCPYDAPKFDSLKKIISKCNLCYTGLSEGRDPACTCACPTGALSFGEIDDKESGHFSWFPHKDLNPAIAFGKEEDASSLTIVPGQRLISSEYRSDREPKNISSEISLLIFSFLAVLSVAVTISSLIMGIFPEKMLIVPLLSITVLASFFHLGKPMRSWRALFNLRNSPLSREIAAFIFYSSVSLSAIMFPSPVLLVSASIAGLILLLLVDNVYLFADHRRSVYLHTGQTFITALLIASFLAGSVIPFLFIASVKLFLSAYHFLFSGTGKSYFGFRFLRLILLIIPALSLLIYNSGPDLRLTFIFLTGEFFDRILFYYDFNPLNINTLIEEKINILRDEKKRG